MNLFIQTDVRDGVQRIEIRRPEKKNALTIAMYAALADALRAAERDERVRAILIHGQPDVFTSGNDLHDFLHNPPQDLEAPVFHFLRALIQADKPIGAARACNWGLINDVVPGDRLQTRTLATLVLLTSRPPAAMRANKTLLRRQLMPHFEAVLEAEAREFHALLSSSDAREALSAFLEKRAPRFAHRT